MLEFNDESKTKDKIVTLQKEIIDAIDKIFSTLGSSGKETFFLNLERNYSITKEEIPSRIEDFSKAVEDIFGNRTFKIVETKIIQILKSKYPQSKCTPDEASLNLLAYVTHLIKCAEST